MICSVTDQWLSHHRTAASIANADGGLGGDHKRTGLAEGWMGVTDDMLWPVMRSCFDKGRMR